MFFSTIFSRRNRRGWYRSIFGVCSVLFILLPAIVRADARHDERRPQLVFGGSPTPSEPQDDAFSSLDNSPSDRLDESKHHNTDTFDEMLSALAVMQDKYFQIWQGIWPTAIDWTSAVLGTYLSAALSTLSLSTDYVISSETTNVRRLAIAHENLINRYFSQLISFYFGQDALSLRNQANDDMLWVVLGWIESIKFVKTHASRHYRDLTAARPLSRYSTSWYGEQWIPSFAHRARIFWEIASKGWDTSLCDGGMVWSPYLSPYKNAITNELWIAASISMYLYFPGDDNTEPFIPTVGGLKPIGPQDPKFLQAAIEGYKWLINSNMTDEMGLFVDGFHISGYDPRKNNSHANTKCDARNEMVYTYNQGVLLTGQRGLWEATSARSYLDDGHVLIKSVINATGYDLKHDRPYQRRGENHGKHGRHGKHGKPRIGDWYGLGRNGILEDACDAFGYCSQNGQTFKGIFFHHLTTFCSTLPPHFVQPGETFNIREFNDLKIWHESSCAEYGGWIRNNAEAAIRTQDDEGRYGTWWGAPSANQSWIPDPEAELPRNAVDYRNEGVPKDSIWRGFKGGLGPVQPGLESVRTDIGNGLQLQSPAQTPFEPPVERTEDWNDRGRGRTVETQGGGVSVLRALWEIVELEAFGNTS